MEIETKANYKIEVKTISDIVNYMKGFNTEMCLNFKDDHLSIIEIDPANVSMSKITLKNNAFIEYSGTSKILINIDMFYNALKVHKKEDVNLNITENTLYLNFSDGFKTEVPLIDMEDYKEQKIPELNYKTSFIMESKKFKNIVKSFYSVNKEDGLIFSNSEKNKKDNLRITSKSDLNKSEVILNEISLNNPLKVMYSIEYLNKFIKVLFDTEFKFNSNDDYPLTIDYKTKNLEVKFILAPRVGDD